LAWAVYANGSPRLRRRRRAIFSASAQRRAGTATTTWPLATRRLNSRRLRCCSTRARKANARLDFGVRIQLDRPGLKFEVPCVSRPKIEFRQGFVSCWPVAEDGGQAMAAAKIEAGRPGVPRRAPVLASPLFCSCDEQSLGCPITPLPLWRTPFWLVEKTPVVFSMSSGQHFATRYKFYAEKRPPGEPS
jgi:hypothetical protein